MSALAVGDVVEVVKVFDERHHDWLGRHLVVIGVNRCDRPHIVLLTGELYEGGTVDTSPQPASPVGTCRHWRPESLRKINPPDFAVPVVETDEVEA